MQLKVTKPDGTQEEIEVSAYEALDPVEPEEAALDSEFVPLVEKAIRRDGEAQIKIIQPGWGSSGYYSKEMLKRDGPKVFKPGTKMYWDHPTASEEAERPERSLRDLAAELTSGAKWQDNGPQGPGLYASAKVFEGYQSAVEQIAPHIGVSIRAMGQARHGEADGRKGPIIEKLVAAKSIDFVTEPGAGGAIVQLFESARAHPQEERPMELTEAKVQEMIEAATKPLQTSLTEAEDKLKVIEAERDAIKAERDQLREGQTLQEAKGLVTEQVNAATLPDVTKSRLIERLSANPPIKDGAVDKDTLKAAVEAAVKDETEYLTKVTGSPIRNMNSVESKQSTDEINGKLEETFKGLGLSESAAKFAAAGRY